MRIQSQICRSYGLASRVTFLSVALISTFVLSVENLCPAHAASNHVVSYLRSVARMANRAYYPPLDVYGSSATVKATVDKNGKLWNFRVLKVPNYTGTDQQDAYLISSLREALTHLNTTPPRALQPSSEIEMKFDTRINHNIIVTASTNIGGIEYSGSARR